MVKVTGRWGIPCCFGFNNDYSVYFIDDCICCRGMNSIVIGDVAGRSLGRVVTLLAGASVVW